MEHFWLLSLAAFLIGTSKGGLAAAGALAVPILSIWMDPLVAAGMLLPVYLISDVFGVWLYRHEYSRPNLAVLIPAGAVGVVLAALLAPYLSAEWAKLATGGIGLAYCLQVAARTLSGGEVAASPCKPSRGWFWGALSGATSFISHTGSPPYQAFVLPQKLPKLEFAGTTVILFTAINIFKLPAYISVGMMSDFNWSSVIAMAMIASAGAYTGRQIAKHLPDRIYMKLIQSILFVLSIYLIASALQQMA